jgi:hypothetical protein
VRGSISSPGIRNYQIYYRDPVPYCTAGTFNLTNAVNVPYCTAGTFNLTNAVNVPWSL